MTHLKLFLLLLVVGLVLVSCGDGGVADATSRVDDLFNELQPDSGQREKAVMIWNTGTMAVTGTVEAAGDFESWCRAGGLRDVRSHTIADARSEEGSNPAAVLVSGTVNGQPFEVRVVKRKPIQWVVKPSR